MLHAVALGAEDVRGTHVRAQAPIPNVFCWAKMGTEAGQPLETILHRKEIERRVGGGTFAWGIGSSLGSAVEFARRLSPSGDVDVLFTPMKSAPKMADVAPSQVLLWLFYVTRSGKVTTLPEHMLVTSRGGNDKRVHYALLCESDKGIEDGTEQCAFDASDVRNLVSCNPVGASQVTSIVRYEGASSTSSPYRVAFKAKLHAEGFVKLVDPIVLDDELSASFRSLCMESSLEKWRHGVSRLKEAALATKGALVRQEVLFA